MKPLDQYPTAEAAEADWVKTKQFLKLSREQRIASFGRLRDKWTQAYAAKAEANGATEQDLTGHVGKILDKVLETIGGQGIGTSAIEGMIPQDNKQLAIDAALFAVGPEAVAGKAASNALLRLGLRLAIPTVGGAIGGATEGDPVGGAARGLVEGVGGEAIAGVGRLGSRTIGTGDFSRLQGWLESRLGVKVPDGMALRRLFRGGEIIPATEKQFAQASTRAKKMLGKGFQVTAPIQGTSVGGQVLPGLTNKISLDDAHYVLNTMEQGGWDYSGNPINSYTGRAIRDQVHQIEGDIAEQMDRVNKKAASVWYTARGKLRAARTLKNMFSEPGVIDDNGRVSMSKLQKLVSDADPVKGYKTDLQQSMGEDEQKYLSKVVHRGAPEGAEDRPGQGVVASRGLGVSVRGSLWGRLSMPYPARHVGNVPFDLGRGRALSAAITLGPYQFMNKLNQMTDMSVVPGSSKTTSGQPLPDRAGAEAHEKVAATVLPAPAVGAK